MRTVNCSHYSVFPGISRAYHRTRLFLTKTFPPILSPFIPCAPYFSQLSSLLSFPPSLFAPFFIFLILHSIPLSIISSWFPCLLPNTVCRRPRMSVSLAPVQPLSKALSCFKLHARSSRPETSWKSMQPPCTWLIATTSQPLSLVGHCRMFSSIHHILTLKNNMIHNKLIV